MNDSKALHTRVEPSSSNFGSASDEHHPIIHANMPHPNVFYPSTERSSPVMNTSITRPMPIAAVNQAALLQQNSSYLTNKVANPMYDFFSPRNSSHGHSGTIDNPAVASRTPDSPKNSRIPGNTGSPQDSTGNLGINPDADESHTAQENKEAYFSPNTPEYVSSPTIERGIGGRVTATSSQDWEAKRTRSAQLYRQREQEKMCKLFNNAHEEAIRREKMANSSPTVTFKVACNTRFGQDVYLVGSDPSIGAWDPDKAIPLSWSPGNIWACTIPFSPDIKFCEYKFIKKENGGVRWESCNNREFKTRKQNKGGAFEVEAVWDLPQ